jgi:hypothetical protein
VAGAPVLVLKENWTTDLFMSLKLPYDEASMNESYINIYVRIERKTENAA